MNTYREVGMHRHMNANPRVCVLYLLFVWLHFSFNTFCNLLYRRAPCATHTVHRRYVSSRYIVSAKVEAYTPHKPKNQDVYLHVLLRVSLAALFLPFHVCIWQRTPNRAATLFKFQLPLDFFFRISFAFSWKASKLIHLIYSVGKHSQLRRLPVHRLHPASVVRVHINRGMNRIACLALVLSSSIRGNSHFSSKK